MDNLFAFCVMALLMSMLPGADTVLILKNTLTFGKKAGRFTILGMAMGLTFWTTVAILGLAIVIAQSVVLFSIIKYAGALYLLFLGIKVLLNKDALSIHELHVTADENKRTKRIYRDAFLQGFISNALNPKTVVVYISFMPQFIDVLAQPNRQLLLLGALLTVIAVSWFRFVVQLVHYAKKWLQQLTVQKVFQKVTGVLLIAFGVKVALERS